MNTILMYYLILSGVTTLVAVIRLRGPVSERFWFGVVVWLCFPILVAEGLWFNIRRIWDNIHPLDANRD